MRRIERLWWWERACRILGILMDATEPLAARRRWCLPSLECSEATNGGLPEISVLGTSCSGWIICNIFAILRVGLLGNIKAGDV